MPASRELMRRAALTGSPASTEATAEAGRSPDDLALNKACEYTLHRENGVGNLHSTASASSAPIPGKIFHTHIIDLNAAQE